MIGVDRSCCAALTTKVITAISTKSYLFFFVYNGFLPKNIDKTLGKLGGGVVASQ